MDRGSGVLARAVRDLRGGNAVIHWARRLATPLLRSGAVNHAVRALAAARGRGLVLVYHRLGSCPAAACIVPTIRVETFRQQLQALGEVADFVTIDELLPRNEPRAVGHRRRLAIALTFDDDSPSHVEHALPVLREFGVPAAFFLSGRALHGLGGYWFDDLEKLLSVYDPRRTASLLGVADAGVPDLALMCERHPHFRRRVGELVADISGSTRVLERSEITALADASMTIGFHTVNHEPLPDLDGSALARAVSFGREELARVTGVVVRYFAYPHGKVDSRSAAAVRGAGFDAAFTGVPRPIRRSDDRHRLGRWEPGPLGVDELMINLAVRLLRDGRGTTEQR